MTVLEAMTWAEGRLKSSAGEKRTHAHNAKIDVQILLAAVLEKPTSYVFSHFDQALTQTQQAQFEALIEGRTRHEPVAYLLGEKMFYGRPFFVDPRTLIPRPETELLVEEALGAIRENTVIIDVGTGSGAIAVTLAAEAGQPIIATDISIETLLIAKRNAEVNHVSHLISFLHGDLLQPYFEKNITHSGPTLILANLPYLPNNYALSMDPDVTKFEPALALYGGEDGLDLYRALLKQLVEHRNRFRDLVLLFEIDPSAQRALPLIVKNIFPSAQVSVTHDLSGQARLLRADVMA